MSASGNMSPQSTTRMRPSTSRQKQLRPISPSPPRKTIRTSLTWSLIGANVSPRGTGLVDHARRNRAQIAHDADPRHEPQAVVGRVDLPPAEALAGGALVAGVGVVPTLPAGHERDEQRVLARVLGLVRAAAHHVRQRVHEERGVPEQHRRREERDQATPAADEPAREAERPRRDPVVRVEEAQLWILREVLDVVVLRRAVLVAQDPADVAPPKTALRRVNVALGVGELVMIAVMRGPPQRTLLGGRRTGEREHELP